MRHILIAVLLLFGAGETLRAQADRPDSRLQTLKSCLLQGLERNFSIRLAKNRQEVDDNKATVANAGLLPTLDLSAGYGADLNSSRSTARATGEVQKNNNVFDQDLRAALNLNWTVFDGMGLVTNYRQLQLLKKQGELQTRIAIEDYIANLTAEYYNFIQQKIRLKNFRYAVSLSKERMRIVEERYHIGNFSRLDYQQAKVDFNADSAQYMKQQENLRSSLIRLNELMANTEVNHWLHIRDTVIDVNADLDFDVLWSATLVTNADVLKADQDTELARMDLKKVMSRNYPYIKVNAGYGYTHNRYGATATRRRDNWGLNAGVTVGLNLFDGSKKADRRNARLDVEYRRLQREEIELSLRADINNLWQAYTNNIQMLQLERQNLIAAVDNHEIARDRYLLGDLSGFEMREAQKSLLDAEERILKAEYDTKMCEISLLQLSGNILLYLR